jgi:EAL domain-containing protein (putative c-di-GMP-specific phosphodiesterase class I)
MPGEFIPTAEETGMIVGLGRWVLREACQQLGKWQDEFPAVRSLTMHVNLSARQFNNPDLVFHVQHALHSSSIEPSRLTLEIAEAALIENLEKAGTMVERLQKLGVQVCIDDFGTGYSSLSYLKKLPVSGLKIDRSFVHKINEGGKNAELVQAIINLARDLEIDVVAEGVETRAEVRTLRNFTCTQFQGYWHSRPAAADEIAALLRDLG